MGLLSSAVGAIGTAISAFGQYQAGQDAKDIYQYNKAIANYQAQYIKEASEKEIEALYRDVEEYVGRQRAIQGKSGLVPDKGSHGRSIARSYEERDIDAALIRWRASKDYELAKMGADVLGTQASQFGRAGTINAATTLLGGLSKWDYKTSTASLPYRPTYATGAAYAPGRP